MFEQVKGHISNNNGTGNAFTAFHRCIFNFSDSKSSIITGSIEPNNFIIHLCSSQNEDGLIETAENFNNNRKVEPTFQLRAWLNVI